MAEPRPGADEDPLRSWRLGREPYYVDPGGQIEAFEAACAAGSPVLLKGPTGCGKTRLVEFMAWRLGRPLVTVACNEDLTASDLVGRWMIDAQGMRWRDGPLALAARFGAICYLDEIAEARADALVVMHPLADTRRALVLGARNELLRAHDDFLLVASYNPQHAGGAQALKASTRQRFCAIACDYPAPELETDIVSHEGGVERSFAARLVELARRTRALGSAGDAALEEGASTRMLVRAAQLVRQGLAPRQACLHALVEPLGDDPEMLGALRAATELAF
ncbi:CbbQ/NirQ/NorQ/GpvN family protein [Thiomonas sp.]|jgi:nitric oxide reductase NorQ protein|uniref:CbbQ/NirQ/NorQ/GpvN family protein n=1 Tax=Thiomonas sp. TaxID=2047785 RepID=UPI002609E797|nr:CbbQ/NirQ/NorQ/GpvN family protein [Thiomonas sp.]